MKLYKILNWDCTERNDEPALVASNAKEAGEKFWPEADFIESNNDTACFKFDEECFFFVEPVKSTDNIYIFKSGDIDILNKALNKA